MVNRDSSGRFVSGGGGGKRRGRRGAQAARINSALERVLSRTVIAISSNAHANLVAAPSEDGTPVDTGWASANWQIGIGKTPKPTSQPKGKAESGAVSSERARQEGGLVDLLSYKLGRGTVFIANSVPYLPILNQDGGKVTAAGFVERAVAKAVLVDIKRLATR